MPCAHEQGAPRKPDGVADGMRDHRGHVDPPADAPCWSFVEVRCPLLAEQLDPVCKPNGEDGLVVGRGCPV